MGLRPSGADLSLGSAPRLAALGLADVVRDPLAVEPPLVLAAALVVRRGLALVAAGGRAGAVVHGAAVGVAIGRRGIAAGRGAGAVVHRVAVGVAVHGVVRRAGHALEPVALVFVDQLVVGHAALVHVCALGLQVRLGTLAFGGLLRHPRLLLGHLGAPLALGGDAVLGGGGTTGLELALGLLALSSGAHARQQEQQREQDQGRHLMTTMSAVDIRCPPFLRLGSSPRVPGRWAAHRRPRLRPAIAFRGLGRHALAPPTWSRGPPRTGCA